MRMSAECMRRKPAISGATRRATRFAHACIAVIQTALATAADFHVSTQAGFNKLSTLDFEPGDRILLQGGMTFTGTLSLGSADTGTDAAGKLIAPIIVTSHGTGRATISAGDGSAILAYKNGGLEISRLNLVGSGVAADGTTTSTKSGLTFYNDAPGDLKFQHIRVDDIEVTGFGSRGVVLGGYNGDAGYHDVSITRVVARQNLHAGIETYGAPGSTRAHTAVRVADCVASGHPGDPASSGNTGSGITLGGVAGGIIERCSAYGNGVNNTASEGPVGIWAYHSSEVVIQHNESFGNRTRGGDGGGFDLDIGTTRSVMQYNFSHGNDGAGFLVYGTAGTNANRGNIVRYNISIDDGRNPGSGAASGISVSDNVRDVAVYGNTVRLTAPDGATGIPAIRVAGFNSRPDDILIANNLLVTAGGSRLVAVSSTDDVTFTGNNYWSSGGPFVIRSEGRNHGSLDAWRAATGQEMSGGEPTGHSVDPRFAEPAGAALKSTDPRDAAVSFKLRADSPLIDRGRDLTADFGIDPGPRDLFGGRVAQGAGFEIGAHEFAVDPPGLLGLSVDPATRAVTIRYQSELGVSFLVRRSADPGGDPATAWTRLAPTAPGDGSVMEYPDAPPAGPAHFYVLQRAE